MPDTVFGLAVLILLFIPGVIFAIQADSQRPKRDLSPLRELIVIAGTGITCDIIVLVGFAVLRFALPGETPDIGKIERAGSPYARAHVISLAWWAFGLFVFACALAWILGRFSPGIAGRIISGQIQFDSAWWELFHAQPDCQNYVSCELVDGSYIAGYLLRYSTDTEETENRELALAAPIMYRPVGHTEVAELENVHALSIRAGQIKYMAVTYLEISQEGS
jgi:hypothetical protein